MVGCCHLSGLWCGSELPRAYGSSRTGSKSTPRAQGTLLQPGCPDPVSPTVVPYLPSACPYALAVAISSCRRDRSLINPTLDQQALRRPSNSFAVGTFAGYAQTMRAVLLAKATVTSILGLRASIPASHDPAGVPR